MKTAFFLFVLLLAVTHSATAQFGFNKPFPLLSTETRLVTESTDSKTPLSRIVELLQDKHPQVRRVAVQSLKQRGDLSVIPALELLRQTEDPGFEISHAISEIKQRATNAPNPRIEYLLEELAKPEYREHQYRDYQYSEYLVELAETGDMRALKLIEDYLQLRSLLIHDPLNSNKRIIDNRQRLQQLYWKIHWKNTPLSQKISDFKTWGEACEKTDKTGVSPKFLIDGISTALAQEGAVVVKDIAKILRDKTTTGCLERQSFNVLISAKFPETAIALRVIADDASLPISRREWAQGILLWQFKDQRTAAEMKDSVLQVLSNNVNATGEERGKVVDALYDLEKLAEAGVDKAKLEDALLPYLAQGNPAALMVARSIGGEKSIAPLLAFINQPDDPKDYMQRSNKFAAVTSLGMIGKDEPQKVIPILINRSYDKDPITRINAIQALARVGNQAVIPVLFDLAKGEKDPKVLQFEVSGIYYAGGKAAVETLNKLKDLALTNKNEWLQELAEEGLLRLEQERRTN